MTTKPGNQQAGTEKSGAASLLNSAYKAGLGAAQTMHQTAVDIPLSILEQMGLEKEKVSALRTKSHKLIDELYHAINTVASKSGLVGDEAKSAESKGGQE